VEATLINAPRRFALPAAAAMLVALILGLAATGKRPGAPALGPSPPRGIIATEPAAIRTIEIRLAKDRFAFYRTASGNWAVAGSDAAAAPELAAHLETALHFMHVSAPARTLDAADYRGTALSDFGLDPPGYVVTLGAADRSRAVADFGAPNPAQTSQYVRLTGQGTLFLLPRHVGTEWQLAADMAKRTLPSASTSPGASPAASALVPVSIDRIWAVEIVADGKLHRFERDRAGSWFLHVGWHSHAGGANEHIADPGKAPIIADALATLEEAQIEALVAQQPSSDDLEHFGLSRPPLIVLLYARDSSAPLARIEIGDAAEDGFSRYAHLSQGGAVVTIAADEARHLTALLEAVGATP
jgi:hypothetical protein